MRTVDDLITWLRAQLNEDELTAKDVASCWPDYYEPGRSDEDDYHLRFAPARVMVEVDAKRRILDEHNIEYPGEAFQYCHVCHDHSRHDAATAPCRTLRLLALPFADRPGYREDWRP